MKVLTIEGMRPLQTVHRSMTLSFHFIGDRTPPLEASQSSEDPGSGYDRGTAQTHRSRTSKHFIAASHCHLLLLATCASFPRSSRSTVACRSAMSTQTQPISLIARQVGSESATPPAPALPPISRKKQVVVLLSAFGTIALTIGYNQCFGVFQEYYLSPTQNVLAASSSASSASPQTALLGFVGTLCYGLTWAGGIIVNPVISRIEDGTWGPTAAAPSTHAWRRRTLRLLAPRTITVLGVVMTSLGFALGSLSSSIGHLLLTQGLLVGLGMSLLYFPLLAPAPEYFTTHRATAMGFILAGGGAGGLIFSPVIRALLSSLGGRWTLRILAGFYLVAGLPIAWTVPRSRFAGVSTAEVPQRRDTHVSRSLASRPTFIFSAVAAFLQVSTQAVFVTSHLPPSLSLESLESHIYTADNIQIDVTNSLQAAGAQLPLAFIPSYTVNLGQTASQGANLLAISNAINAVSRVLIGYVGDRLGRQNLVVVTLCLSGISVFALWLTSVLATASSSLSLWLAFIVLYSFTAGGYYALFPALIAEVFGIRQYAAVNAFILFVRGLGTMFGTPVGGQLLGKPEHGARAYTRIAYWDGALLLGATACCVGVRWADGKGKGWRWVA
ncbi:major facilitator superfamily domain-containing protein [Xylariaceae sp. FL1019]|nr:major facilitator superfamily domain-containing protein [Xylariaceae sp. FL1019]